MHGTRCDGEHAAPQCPDPSCWHRRHPVINRKVLMEADGWKLWQGGSFRGKGNEDYAHHAWIEEPGGGYHSHSIARTENLALVLTFAGWVSTLRGHATDQDAMCAACCEEQDIEHRAGCPCCGKDFL
jgi:hypothetical protein